MLKKLGEYCEPRRNTPLERYKFNRRVPGDTQDQYRTALQNLAEDCSFETITPDKILCDRLLFDVRANKLREGLLRGTKLAFEKTDEICRASEYDRSNEACRATLRPNKCNNKSMQEA